VPPNYACRICVAGVGAAAAGKGVPSLLRGEKVYDDVGCHLLLLLPCAVAATETKRLSVQAVRLDFRHILSRSIHTIQFQRKRNRILYIEQVNCPSFE
jgi:hypothetical protein